MKIVLICLLFVSFASSQYSTKYENINIDEILESDRLLNNYFKCLMGKGPCTPDADELKKILPEAIRTNCEKCSEIEKEKTKKVVAFLIKNKPEMWKDLCGKYDPENIYSDKFKQELGL